LGALDKIADLSLAERVTAFLEARPEVVARAPGLPILTYALAAAQMGRNEGLEECADVARAAYLSILLSPKNAAEPLHVCRAFGLPTTSDNLRGLEADFATMLRGREEN
jgi:hypothetical protein